MLFLFLDEVALQQKTGGTNKQEENGEKNTKKKKNRGDVDYYFWRTKPTDMHADGRTDGLR
jgi:hypothetical protein